MDESALHVIDDLLARAARACGLDRARALSVELADLCRAAGDDVASPCHDAAALRIAALEPDQIAGVLRFVVARFHLLNQAEQVHITGVNRARARFATPERPRAESIQEALLLLRNQGCPAEHVRELAHKLDVQPTLTAHPTEAKRRTILDNLVKAAEHMRTLTDPEAAQAERSRAERRLLVLMQILLVTDEVRPRRLEVLDEVRNGLYYLQSSIWHAAPRLARELAESADALFGPRSIDPTELPPVIRYRTWIGGDRDGNPRVTHHATHRTIELLRASAIDLWDRELFEIQRELTLSDRRVPVPNWFTELVAESARSGSLGSDERAWIAHRTHEPFRVRLMQMRTRLREDAAYDGRSLLSDLLTVRDAVDQSDLHDVARDGALADAVLRARIFGLHLATLDIRQHSRVHEAAVAELLALAGITSDYAGLPEDARVEVLRAELAQPRPLRPVNAALSETTDELMRTLDVVRLAVDRDRRAVRSYVISMTHGLSDVLEVLLLMKESGLSGVANPHVRAAVPDLRSRVHIVPLLETIDDLRRGESLVSAMLDEPVYRAHLDSLVPEGAPHGAHPMQEIMLGYSDSNKDGGFFMANAALEHAQRAIARAVHTRNVELRFFHGRGGTVGRGGGRAGRAILAAPAPARSGRLRFTEQGEVISFRYGLAAMAERHLEQILHAALLASGHHPEQTRQPALNSLLTRLADDSMHAYRRLIDDPEFWSWFTAAGPIGAIAGLPIASRPVMRTHSAPAGRSDPAASNPAPSGSLDSLRAIPWVFTWIQMRCLAPGWYGLGSALDACSDAELDALAGSYRDSLWLQTVVDNAVRELMRARMSIARRYALAVPTPAAQRFLGLIVAEHDRTVRGVLRVSGRASLADESPIIARSIVDRNPWTDVLNLIQIELLNRQRLATTALRGEAPPPDDRIGPEVAQLLQQSVSAIAAAMQSTG
ncbi:MAG: phosphoenolpyruvate carboxylase [Phycisphaeraceae bacterium]|nr:phosphoenolpyruvate carboxylase [Phycisphaeraceae bacterium]